MPPSGYSQPGYSKHEMFDHLTELAKELKDTYDGNSGVGGMRRWECVAITALEYLDNLHKLNYE